MDSKGIKIVQKARPQQTKYVCSALEVYDDSYHINISEEETKFNNLIFDKTVSFRVKTNCKINIENSTFEGSLIVMPDDAVQITIFIYNVSVNGNISLNREATYISIELDTCSAKSVIITDYNADNVTIYKSDFQQVIFEGTTVKELSIKRSMIRRFSIFDFEPEKVYLDVETILCGHKSICSLTYKNFIDIGHIDDCNNKICEMNELLKSKVALNPNKSLIEFKSDVVNNIKVYNDSITEHKNGARLNFLRFIKLAKLSIDESVDDIVIADLSFVYFRNRKYRIILFILLWCVGFFYKPFRVLVCSTAVIISFGLIYYAIANFQYSFFPIHDFTLLSTWKQIAIDLVNAIYFSGITFFTIGFGDIAGNDSILAEVARKGFVLVEAGLGILLSSTLLISFLNRHQVTKQ
jgi:hypothetical protein